MEKGELQAGDKAILLSDHKSAFKSTGLLGRRGEIVEVKFITHYPVIIVEGKNGSFSIKTDKLEKIK